MSAYAEVGTAGEHDVIRTRSNDGYSPLLMYINVNLRAYLMVNCSET